MCEYIIERTFVVDLVDDGGRPYEEDIGVAVVELDFDVRVIVRDHFSLESHFPTDYLRANRRADDVRPVANVT